MFDEIVQDTKNPVQVVINLDIKEGLLIDRLTGREICRNCNSIYHKTNKPSKIPGICDKCGSELYQRADDSLETAKSRLAVFHKQTQPLIEYYEKLGLLYNCKNTELDDIVAELASVLE